MNSRYILLIGGLLLLLSSVIYGLIYEAGVNAEEQSSWMYNLNMALTMAANGNSNMASAYIAQFGAESATREIQARIPLHLALAGAMTIAPLWILGILKISERLKRILALFIVVGGAVVALGDLFQLTSWAYAGHYLVLLGASWLILGQTGFLLYLLLHVWAVAARPAAKRR